MEFDCTFPDSHRWRVIDPPRLRICQNTGVIVVTAAEPVIASCLFILASSASKYENSRHRRESLLRARRGSGACFETVFNRRRDSRVRFEAHRYGRSEAGAVQPNF